MFISDLYSPNLLPSLQKTVSNVTRPGATDVLPGEQLEYTIQFQNTGLDGAIRIQHGIAGTVGYRIRSVSGAAANHDVDWSYAPDYRMSSRWSAAQLHPGSEGRLKPISIKRAANRLVSCAKTGNTVTSCKGRCLTPMDRVQSRAYSDPDCGES